MAAALGSPHEVSGAAYLPPGIALPPVGAATVALRVEGPMPSVAFRRDGLLHEHGGTGFLADAEFNHLLESHPRGHAARRAG